MIHFLPILLRWRLSAVPEGKELVGFQELEWLELSRTKISNAGVKDLIRLKKLRLIGVSDTEITDAGFKELGKSLPGLLFNN